MQVEFDSDRFSNDVQQIINSRPRGAANQIIKETGVSHASFYRLMRGPPVKNIDLLLSVSQALGLKLNAYIVGQKKPVAAAKNGALIEWELVRPQYVERHFAKGYMTRDFYVGQRRYRWFGNVPTPVGVVRIGVVEPNAG